MKRYFRTLCLGTLCTIAAASANATEWQGEKLTRGCVALSMPSGGNFVSWRLLATDNENTTFDVVRNGQTVASDITLTNFTDAYGDKNSTYKIVTRQNGTISETSDETAVWDDIYKRIRLERPANGTTPDGEVYHYMPQEASAADLDGDGNYELVVKWLPSNQKDNASSGYTGNCILDAYTLDGRKLWRVDLGRNIRSGSHYTQFMVYDFDGDGKAEMICKTAPGSTDGQGNYVTQAADDENIRITDNSIDYRSADEGRKGKILEGPEYLSVFDGCTGKALHTIWYNPNRGFTTGCSAAYGDWGDNYGNRGDRFLACVAHLDGYDKRPSAVMCRGYYTRAYLWAVDFDGSKLSTKWLHASITTSMVQLTDAEGKKTSKLYSSNTSGTKKSYTAYGQGCHCIGVADVDNDGADEIIYGSATIDNNGSLLYSTGLGHGDALHVGDLMPDREGTEVFLVHEDAPYGWDVHDARTGELILHVTGNGDTGAGLAADIDPLHRGAEFWSSDSYNVYDTEGNIISSSESARPTYRHRFFWDGTPFDNTLNSVKVYSGYNKQIMNFGVHGNSVQWGSKGYPTLFGDILGDWREEIIFFDKTDSCTLNLFSTTMPTQIRIPTLMHDHQYRMAMAWQNTSYNMAPRISYYLPDSVCARITYDNGKHHRATLGAEMTPIAGRWHNCTEIKVSRTLLDGKVIRYMGIPTEQFSFTKDAARKSFSIEGKPDKEGVYEFVLTTVDNPTGYELSDTVTVKVTADTDGISVIDNESTQNVTCYDIAGRRIARNGKRPNGIMIVRRNNGTAKVCKL